MNFQFDVFLSYAHLDDAALVEGRKGWVANLHRALELRVGMFHGKSPHIWRDPKLEGNDVLVDQLKELVRQAAALVSVVTPRYVRSESTALDGRIWTRPVKVNEPLAGVTLIVAARDAVAPWLSVTVSRAAKLPESA